jgi:hypothetical protein
MLRGQICGSLNGSLEEPSIMSPECCWKETRRGGGSRSHGGGCDSRDIADTADDAVEAVDVGIKLVRTRGIGGRNQKRKVRTA